MIIKVGEEIRNLIDIGVFCKYNYFLFVLI
jgi:hypothetical protein